MGPVTSHSELSYTRLRVGVASMPCLVSGGYIYAIAVVVQPAYFTGVRSVQLAFGPTRMYAVIIKNAGVDNYVPYAGDTFFLQRGYNVVEEPVCRPVVFAVGGPVA